ncbi:MAG: NADH-quinone oxidoreductase subunit H, partial [Actinomycetota bacterium]|nr:NADH-quinone oxidoreductase subunit H [Actinomycetota bacterium]
KLGWKFLIPASLVWIIAVSAVRVVRLEGGIDQRWILITGAAIFVVLVALAFIPDKGQDEVDEDPAEPAPFDAFAGGYPVPPMPGQQLPELAAVITADQQQTDRPTDQQGAHRD